MAGLTYNIDIVMCIDVTASMGPILSEVKESALRFNEELAAEMGKKQKMMNELRVRVIGFRDLRTDGPEHGLISSGFFSLPTQQAAFKLFVEGLTPEGGGDAPESGLEALATAIKSEWVLTGDRRRHIIVLWTDAGTYSLEDVAGKGIAGYPGGLPASFSELTSMWSGQEGMNYSAKRLIIYAPEAYPWTEIAAAWEEAVVVPSAAGTGLKDLDMSEVYATIVNSV